MCLTVCLTAGPRAKESQLVPTFRRGAVQRLARRATVGTGGAVVRIYQGICRLPQLCTRGVFADRSLRPHLLVVR